MASDIKIHHDLNFSNARNLIWYTGVYLCLPRIFMSIVRKKLVHHPLVESVLIPLQVVTDPVSKRSININITDRYFFIGTKKELNSETDIGLGGYAHSITLLRNREKSDTPSKINIESIQHVINTHIRQRYSNIQEDVTVHITGGTFKDWYGVVEKKIISNPDTVHVRFNSDEYSYSTDMPTALCKTTY